MKKKFINGLLLVALFVGFTGSMVSCKDYDDEKVEDLRAKLNDAETSLRTALEAQKKALESEIASLDAALKNCQETCASFRTTINEKLKEYLTITQWTTSLNEFRTELGGIYYTQDYINKTFYTKDEVDNLFKSLSNYYTKEEIDNLLNGLRDEMKKYVEISSLEQTIANMVSEGKDKLTDALETYFVNNETIRNYIKGLGLSENDVKKIVEEALVSVNSTIQEVKSTADEALALAKKNEGAITELQGTVSTLQGTVSTIQSNLATVQGDVAKLQETATKLQGLIDGLQSSVTTLQNDLKTLQGTVTTLQGTVTNLQQSVVSLGEQLDKVQSTANEAKATADANSKLIANLQSSYNTLNTKVEGLEGTVEGLKSMIADANKEIDALKEQVAANKEEADKLHREMLETISGLASGLDALEANLGSLKSEFEANKAEVKGELKTLQDNIDAANANIAKNTVAIEKLADLFENTMAKLITGIEINRTYNPLFGGFNLPFDVRSNVLVAFHGLLDDYGVRFPTTNAAYYALPELEQYDIITEKDLEMLGVEDLSEVKGYVKLNGNRYITNRDDAEGNAGKVYLTINPTDRDFTGTEFTLIDSRNNTSVVTLSDLKKSDNLIEFGYTRGGVVDQSPNGFYEAKATFKAEDLEKGNRLDFDLTNIKEIAQDLKNWEGENNLTRIMTVIYQNLNNVLPANAVKATWTDDLGTKSVVSQYSIAATSVRPLSFAFGKDISYDRIPGYDKAEDFIDGLIDKIFAAMPDLSFLWDKFDIDRIEIDELTGDLTAKFHVYFNTRSIVSTGPKSVTISLPSYTLNGINGEKVTIHPKNPQITVTIADNDAEIIVEYNIEAELEYMARYCTEPVENIKAQIADFLEDVNDFIDSITGFTFQNVGDKFISGLNEYMQKITQNLWRFLHPNSLMQPTMLLKNTETGKYAIMSRSGKVPSKMNKTNFLIIPTTYTAELLSPAYKKFVAVTNVFKDGVSAQDGDADCKSVLDKANAQSRINEVIEGGFDEFIRFEGQNGYIYEFLYTAVDYSGKVFANKYYVKVSE